MKLINGIALAAVAALVAITTVQAHEVSLGDLSITKAWTRATPPRAMAGGGFVEITNHGATDDRLISASSPVAGRVELHDMSIKDGVMVMREKEGGIEIPAGQSVALQPGGLHIMFMELKGGFKAGAHVPVTLTFEKAGEIQLDLEVAKMGAKEMDHSHMDHGNMKDGEMDHSKMGHGNMGHGDMNHGDMHKKAE